MPAPSLSIPIKLDLDQLKEQLRQTSSLTGTAARQMAKQFLGANKDLAKDAIFATMARGAVDLAGKVACQSAFKFDPSSASNFDPFVRRVLLVALVSSELAGIAEARRARVA